ncbi:hypothetical protein CTT39_13185 [Agrobacterium rosae]|nr:hypothetical protein CTT39_13185 [Agrobacterium rosae]
MLFFKIWTATILSNSETERNISLQLADRALALKPSASIAAKKMVSELHAAGHKIIDFTIPASLRL